MLPPSKDSPEGEIPGKFLVPDEFTKREGLFEENVGFSGEWKKRKRP